MADERLFEQTEDTNPALSMRLAFGKVATPTGNITLQNFVNWLLGKLAFLKTASNLSDLDDPADARTNLSVYSKTETDNLLNAKENTITSTAVLDGTAVSAKVEAATFVCKAKRWGSIVTVTGKIKITSAPSAGEVLFTLPASVGVPSVDWYFGTFDAGASDNVNELYVESGTSNVKSYGYSNARESVFTFTYSI